MWRPGAWRKRIVNSNLNAGWIPCLPTVDLLIEETLSEPEGGIIGTAKGDELRVMVYGS